MCSARTFPSFTPSSSSVPFLDNCCRQPDGKIQSIHTAHRPTPLFEGERGSSKCRPLRVFSPKSEHGMRRDRHQTPHTQLAVHDGKRDIVLYRCKSPLEKRGRSRRAKPVIPRFVCPTADLMWCSLPTEERGGREGREKRCGDSGCCVGGRGEEEDQGARAGVDGAGVGTVSRRAFTAGAVGSRDHRWCTAVIQLCPRRRLKAHDAGITG